MGKKLIFGSIATVVVIVIVVVIIVVSKKPSTTPLVISPSGASSPGGTGGTAGGTGTTGTGVTAGTDFSTPTPSYILTPQGVQKLELREQQIDVGSIQAGQQNNLTGTQGQQQSLTQTGKINEQAAQLQAELERLKELNKQLTDKIKSPAPAPASGSSTVSLSVNLLSPLPADVQTLINGLSQSTSEITQKTTLLLGTVNEISITNFNNTWNTLNSYIDTQYLYMQFINIYLSFIDTRIQDYNNVVTNIRGFYGALNSGIEAAKTDIDSKITSLKNLIDNNQNDMKTAWDNKMVDYNANREYSKRASGILNNNWINDEMWNRGENSIIKRDMKILKQTEEYLKKYFLIESAIHGNADVNSSETNLGNIIYVFYKYVKNFNDILTNINGAGDQTQITKNAFSTTELTNGYGNFFGNLNVAISNIKLIKKSIEDITIFITSVKRIDEANIKPLIKSLRDTLNDPKISTTMKNSLAFSLTSISGKEKESNDNVIAVNNINANNIIIYKNGIMETISIDINISIGTSNFSYKRQSTMGIDALANNNITVAVNEYNTFITAQSKKINDTIAEINQKIPGLNSYLSSSYYTGFVFLWSWYQGQYNLQEILLYLDNFNTQFLQKYMYLIPLIAADLNIPNSIIPGQIPSTLYIKSNLRPFPSGSYTIRSSLPHNYYLTFTDPGNPKYIQSYGGSFQRFTASPSKTVYANFVFTNIDVRNNFTKTRTGNIYKLNGFGNLMLLFPSGIIDDHIPTHYHYPSMDAGYSTYYIGILGKHPSPYGYYINKYGYPAVDGDWRSANSPRNPDTGRWSYHEWYHDVINKVPGQLISFPVNDFLGNTGVNSTDNGLFIIEPNGTKPNTYSIRVNNPNLDGQNYLSMDNDNEIYTLIKADMDNTGKPVLGPNAQWVIEPS